MLNSRKFCLSLAAFLLGVGCSSIAPEADERPPEPLTVNECEIAPEFCNQVCAGCADYAGCVENGGVCMADTRANTRYYIDDATDGGSDIWKGGCHWRYTDAACTANKTFHYGDLCASRNPVALIEWTNAKCHAPVGDTSVFDCNKECVKKGFGGGTCKVLKDHCGRGRASAKCECDKIVEP